MRSGRNKVAPAQEGQRKKHIQIDLADPNMTITEEEDSNLSAHSDIVKQVDKFLQDIDSNKHENQDKSERPLVGDISATKLMGMFDNGTRQKSNQPATTRAF